jgi:subfamily B ATP-binding cassette protein MsbA
LLTLAQSILSIRIGFGGLMRVRCELFQKLQALSIGYHKSTPQGDAVYRLATDTYGFQAILNTFLNSVVASIVMLLIMTGIMFTLSWQLTLISLAVIPLLLFMTTYGSRSIRAGWDIAKSADTDLTTAVHRSVAAISLVQAYGRERDEYARFEQTARQSVRSYIRVHLAELRYALTIGLIFGVATAAIFGFGGYLVYRDRIVLNLGENGMTVGSLYIFLAYLLQVYVPLQRLAGTPAVLQGSASSAQRVFEVLDRDPVIRDVPGAIDLPRAPRTLAIDKISFEYRAGEPVFEEVEFSLPPGAMVGLVGFSGVGKTTLLNLLPRFYDPMRGAIRLDNHDIRSVKIKDVRKHFAMVLQESVILPTTVAENIAYGKPDATEEQIRTAADLARAAEFIEKLPEKYQTIINEHGSNLSGGQRQRIGIARALLSDAPILVLDEPTSALDPANELMIVETLYALRKTRTIILVSHRISTVADCDRIYVMDQGRLVESGTHEQLLQNRGAYYRMARHQMKLADSPADPQDGEKSPEESGSDSTESTRPA